MARATFICMNTEGGCSYTDRGILRFSVNRSSIYEVVQNARLQVLTLAGKKLTVLCNIAPCSLVEDFRRF